MEIRRVLLLIILALCPSLSLYFHPSFQLQSRFLLLYTNCLKHLLVKYKIIILYGRKREGNTKKKHGLHCMCVVII